MLMMETNRNQSARVKDLIGRFERAAADAPRTAIPSLAAGASLATLESPATASRQENKSQRAKVKDLIVRFERTLDAPSESPPRRGVASAQRTNGPEDVVAASISNVATCLYNTGKLDEDFKVSYEALDVDKRVLGPDHPHVADSLTNLGSCLKGMGKFNEALATHREALDVRKRALGPDHPDVAVSLTNVAECLRAVGKLNETLEIHRAALDVFKRALGPDPNAASRLAIHPSSSHRRTRSYSKRLPLCTRINWERTESTRNEEEARGGRSRSSCMHERPRSGMCL